MERNMIKVIIFDIDGVITDGHLSIDENGKEIKVINYKDIDGINCLMKAGFILGAITGEATAIVEWFRTKFDWDYFYEGVKDKIEVLHEIITSENLKLDEICYVGDSIYDLAIAQEVGFFVCPADAISQVKRNANYILKHEAGQGAVMELYDFMERINNAQVSLLEKRMNSHLKALQSLYSSKFLNNLYAVQDLLIQCLKGGHTIFLCGNGGSAADAQHIAAEFVGRFLKEREAWHAEALSADISVVTALSNDYGYDIVFSRQLEAKSRHGDVVIGITTSGNSNNIVNAFKYAKENSLYTVLFAGDYNRKMLCSENADYILGTEGIRDTSHIQEIHIFIGHLLAEYVEKAMA